jgi:hypothetical protein
METSPIGTFLHSFAIHALLGFLHVVCLSGHVDFVAIDVNIYIFLIIQINFLSWHEDLLVVITTALDKD